MKKGHAGQGASVQFLRAIYAMLGKRGVKVRGLYARSYRNETGDMLARDALGGITHWGAGNSPMFV